MLKPISLISGLRKGERTLQLAGSHRVGFVTFAMLLAALMTIISFGATTNARNAAVGALPPRLPATKAFWLQTMDSCRQAIPGAKFQLTGNGLSVVKGPTPGT